MLGAERSLDPGEGVLNFCRERPQGVAVRRQSDAPGRARNKRLANNFLKSPNMRGDRRLRQMQLLRRRRDFSTFRNSEERSEKPQVKIVRVYNQPFCREFAAMILMP